MKTLLTIVLSWMCLGLMAQGELSFVQSAPDTVPPGEAFAVTFVLENGKGANFMPPEWGRLQKVAGPSVSSQFSSINGNVTQKLEYTFHLLAPEEGIYNLYPASIEVDDKVLKTPSCPIIAREGHTLPSKKRRQDTWRGWEWRDRLEETPKPKTPKRTYRI